MVEYSQSGGAFDEWGGRRRGASAAGIAETLIYDSQKLIAEGGVSAMSRYYLSEGGSVYSPLVSQLGSQHWFLFDALGSTLGLTNEAGSLTDMFRYEAFGTSLGRTGTTATPFLAAQPIAKLFITGCQDGQSEVLRDPFPHLPALFATEEV